MKESAKLPKKLEPDDVDNLSREQLILLLGETNAENEDIEWLRDRAFEYLYARQDISK